MVEKSPRPKVRPQKIKESKPLAPEKSIRPKTREQVRVEDEMRQFGNLEFRADMEDQLSWNPLARLGFEPDQSVVGRPAYNSPHIYEGIRYPYDSEREYIDKTLPRAASGAEYRDIVGRVKPGSVIVNSNTAKNPVWSHEYTHGGLEKVMEYLDEDRDFFTEKYGEDTVRLLDEIRSDTDRSKGPNEKLTEMLDDVSKDLEVDLEGNLIPAAGTALGKMDNTRTAVEDWAASPTSKSMRSRRTLQEYLKLGRVKDEKLHKSDIESAFPGYVGIFEAAEDMLEAQGEPLPTEKRGWLKRTLSKMGFDEGGLADYRKRIVDMTEEELAEVAPSASNFSNVYGDRTDEPLSVQMGRMGFEFTPVGTVMGIDEIRQELQKEDPDYFKIGMMGGLEVLGLLPVLGDVAVSAIKAGAKKAGLNKSSNQIDNIPDGTRQIMAGPGAKDYHNRALEKAAKMKSEGASAAEIEEMTGRVATAAPGSEISKGFPYQYKFEIPDAEIKIENPVANYADRNGLTVKESLEQVTNKSDDGFSLESFIPSHSELFRQYPDLKKVIVGFTDKEGYSGFYDPSNNSINISTELFERGVNSVGFRSTFFHELQHAVQAQDAIETGMNFIANNSLESMKILSGASRDSSAKNMFETHLKDDKNLLNTRSELLALGEQILKNPNSKKLSEKLAYKYQQLQDEVYLNYLRYGKEVEARIAGERATGTKGRSVVEEKANQLPDRVEFGSKINKPPNFLNRLSKALGMRPAKMTPKYLQKNIDEAMDFIISYNEAEDYNLAKAMMKSLDNPEPNSSPNQIKRYRDDIDPEVYDAFDELAEIQRGAPELAMTSAQRALEGGVLSYALEHTGDLTHRMAEKGGVYGSEYVKPKVNRLLDSLTSEYGFEKEHLENLKNTAQFNYDKLGKDTNLSFEQFYKEYVDKAQEKIKAYAEEHKKVPVYNDMQLAGREAAIAIGEGRYTDAVEHLYLVKMAIDDGSYPQKAIEFNPNIDFRKNSDQGFAQGGVVNDMNRQMNLFSRGGLGDDGMQRDPVSGNEIPPGSLAEEVRDDIPAQLSEGEYVVPADVVRFFGVKYFEDLRAEAKMGLQGMEADGRIGGEPVGMPMAQASNPNEITEEDLAQLEQMLSTGVANGGLMDKIAIAAKTDKVINDRMNANGMVVGYATGGEVTAPTASYADPTRVDAVINKVMVTLQQKPELIQELSKRGIQISRTNPSMQAGQMNQANPPSETRKAFAVGGMPTVPGYGMDTSYMTPTGLPSWASIPGSSYTYQGPGVPDATGQIPATTTPDTAPAVATNAADACRAMGMGYDPATGTCILVDSGDSGPTTAPEPAEFKWEEPDVNYFKMSEEELAAIGTGAKIDPFMNKLALGAAAVAGPLGLLIGGYNIYQQSKAISEIRSAALVAKARGFDDLAETLSKQAEDLVGKSSFLTQAADKFGGLSGSNDFFQQIAAFSPEGFKLDGDMFKDDPALQKRYVEAVGKAMETRYDKQQAASNFGVTTAAEQRAILSDPVKLKEAQDKAAAYAAEKANQASTTVTTNAPWVSNNNNDSGNTAHEDMMRAISSSRTTDPSGHTVTETTYSTPGGGTETYGADEDGAHKGGLMRKRKKK